MPLEKFDDPYRMDKYNELFKEEKKDTTKKKDAKDSVVAIKIDTNKIMDRLEQIGPDFGSQYLITVLQKGDKTMCCL